MGCGESKRLPTEPDGGGPDPNATFSRVQGEVFSPSCALSGCHAGAGPAAGLDLGVGAARANLVRVPSSERSDLYRVLPRDPAASYLVKKLRGDPDIAGSRMPLDRPPLGASHLQLVSDWIERGAPED